MSSFQTKYSSSIIQYQDSERRESGVGLHILLKESLSMCDNLDKSRLIRLSIFSSVGTLSEIDSLAHFNFNFQ